MFGTRTRTTKMLSVGAGLAQPRPAQRRRDQFSPAGTALYLAAGRGSSASSTQLGVRSERAATRPVPRTARPTTTCRPRSASSSTRATDGRAARHLVRGRGPHRDRLAPPPALRRRARWLFDCGLYQGQREEADARQPQPSASTPGRARRGGAVARAPRPQRQPADAGRAGLPRADPRHRRRPPTSARVDAGGQRAPAWSATSSTSTARAPRAAAAAQPLYAPADVDRTLERFEPHDYHEPWELSDGRHASRSSTPGTSWARRSRTFEFSERRPHAAARHERRPGPAARGPSCATRSVPPGVDALVIESTYGDRAHPPRRRPSARAGGDRDARRSRAAVALMVPAFAVGRTQELVDAARPARAAARSRDAADLRGQPAGARGDRGVPRSTPSASTPRPGALRCATAGRRSASRACATSASAEESQGAQRARAGRASSSPPRGCAKAGRILHHLQHGVGDAQQHRAVRRVPGRGHAGPPAARRRRGR